MCFQTSTISLEIHNKCTRLKDNKIFVLLYGCKLQGVTTI